MTWLRSGEARYISSATFLALNNLFRDLHESFVLSSKQPVLGTHVRPVTQAPSIQIQ